MHYRLELRPRTPTPPPHLYQPRAGDADDVRAGRVDDAVLTALLELARTHILDIAVLSDGHPQNDFGTERQSNHTRGRAVDIRRVDDRLVADPATPRDLLAGFMVAAGALGATEVGGPWDHNDERSGYFTDQVHRDHLELGFSPGQPPATP